MAVIRRTVHVVAWIGTLAVALLAIGLIVSQTPWFRDWIRRTIIRESKQYLNGELTIGRVTGNLFFDFGLTDVAVDLSGERIVSVKALAVGIFLSRNKIRSEWGIIGDWSADCMLSRIHRSNSFFRKMRSST